MKFLETITPITKAMLLGASASTMAILTSIWIQARNTPTMDITLLTNTAGENIYEIIIFAALAIALTAMMISELWDFHQKTREQ